MKKSVRRLGIIVASPLVLFVIVCVLVYLPPIQNFLVNTATRYASEATGMQISIGRISLSFPLDLVVRRTLVVEGSDTILSADRLTAKVRLLPLFKKKVELDGLELRGASVNTAGLMEGMVLKGTLGNLFIASHGVELSPETAVVNELTLKDTHLSMCLADTASADTASSAPVYWKFQLQKIDLENVSFALQMPLDTLRMGFAVEGLSLRDGEVDLHRMAYGARTLAIKGGRAGFDSGTLPPAEAGLDPSHIALTDLNLRVDSAHYAGNDIYALIRDFNLKERSGLEITSGEGRLVSDAHTLRVPSLRVKTPDSVIELNASMDWDAMDSDKEGAIRARLMADIGKNDLLKVVPGMPDEFVRRYPAAPLRVRAGIDGSLNDLRLTALSLDLEGALRAEADGRMVALLDSVRRNGSLRLAMQTGDLGFVEALAGGLALPSGMKLEGTVSLDGNRLDAGMTFRDGARGKVSLDAGYDLASVDYRARIAIDSLNLHRFLPRDSLYGLSASLHAEGSGLDFFSPHTTMEAGAEVSHLRYGHRLFSGLKLEAGLRRSQGNVSLSVSDHAIDASVNLDASLSPRQIKADLEAQVKRLDLQALSVTPDKLTPSLRLHARAQTDLKKSHRVQVSLTDIHLATSENTFSTKDLHAGVEMASDSIRSYVNAGDLTFLFRSPDGLERLSAGATALMEAFDRQWKARRIDQRTLKSLLPRTELRVFSGSDNPIANLIASNHIRYDRFRMKMTTSPDEGLSADMRLYGLRTDSLRLDTIFFDARQDTARFLFHSGVKALASKRQEAFDIGMAGSIDSTRAGLRAVYLNDKREKGVDLGLEARLHPDGISLHVSPENPILVYRPFRANRDNYIYLSDAGRIHADLSLTDSLRTGLSLYSTPDSLSRQDLTLALNRIDIAEFRRVVPYMPDIAGLVSAEAHYVQTETDMQVAADVQVERLAYNRQPLGDWGVSAVYLPQEDGIHGIDGWVSIDGEEVLSLDGAYASAPTKQEEDRIEAGVTLQHFPLHIANAFIPGGMATLRGDLDGKITVGGSTLKPSLDGELVLDSVQVGIPQASLTLRLDNRPVQIQANRLVFDGFNIFTEGQTPFTIDGYVDMNDFAAMDVNLRMNARNFELINAKRTKESLVYGKLYVDFSSVVKGSPDALTMRGNMNILGNSDFTYILKDSPLTVEDRLSETVTFVDFRDTARVDLSAIEPVSLGGMDVLMTLHIDEAVQARVDLNEDGSNYMLLEGGGDLSFQYQPDGNMVLNGRYSLMSGEMKYEMPIIPLKTFHIQSGSYIEWTGELMNPNMNIKASERVRASVSSEDSGSRMVNFDVGVSLTNRLENLGFAFTLEAPDDGTMQNELAGKSAEEKNKLAVTMLVTGMYIGDGGSTGKGFDTNSMLNSFLQSEINKVAGSALKSIDINFGMETTEQESGASRTDYNFQFAKRFWNNRFQVVIGGKISTGNDAQQQEESFIDNISLEYRLDNSGTRYIKIFHDKNYESVLDGEVIETGVGIVLRKKVSKLGELFIFRSRKKDKPEEETESGSR